MSDSAQKRDKRYNITGQVGQVQTREMKGDQKFVTFTLSRADKPPVACIAFAETAAKFLAQFAEGSTASAYGFFEKRETKNTAGEARTYNRFHVLWSGVRERKAAETPAETAIAA